MAEITLDQLLPGAVAEVCCVSGARVSAKRLSDMGFVRGVRVEMIRPGRPCIVRIGGVRVGLGKENQASIGVTDD